MTVKEMYQKTRFTVINAGNDCMEISGVYCCDLLSFVMSKAYAGCAWVTVMGNINSIAVATLAEISCIILADGVIPDEKALEKATEHNVPILSTDNPVFEAALAVHTALKND